MNVPLYILGYLCYTYWKKNEQFFFLTRIIRSKINYDLRGNDLDVNDDVYKRSIYCKLNNIKIFCDVEYTCCKIVDVNAIDKCIENIIFYSKVATFNVTLFVKRQDHEWRQHIRDQKYSLFKVLKTSSINRVN